MSDVPSNLIPTRITQLPLAPVADENSLMMIVYQGNNYQIRVGDLLSVAGVPTSTQVIAGTGLTGGGQLTGNVTLSVAVGGIGNTQLADTGVAAATYGDSTNIPVFTVDAKGRIQSATTVPATGGSGTYVPTTRQVIAGTGLNGGGELTSNVTLNANLSSAAPLATDGLGAAGSSTDITRADHQHPSVNLGVPSEVDGVLSVANGGTSRSIVPSAGAIIWSGADGLYVGPVGASGQVLVSGGTGEPAWGSALLVIDQPANVVYAGPASGPDAPTAFRNLVNADLPTSGVAANTYGSTTSVPVITVNSKGVITSVSTATITGGLVYQGSWNASTNTPTLVSSTGVNGFYYVVSVAGSTNLDGVTDWQVGDWAIFNGSTWQKIDQTNLVSSVNGQVGAVSIAYADLAGAIPTWNQNTTGTAANVTGVVSIANGGSGQTTASAAFNALSPITTTGDLILGNGTNSATRLGIGTDGYLLTATGGTAAWAAAPASVIYPGAGIPNSTGTAWSTSYTTTGTGTVVALATSPVLITPTLSGATVGSSSPYVDFNDGAATTLAAGRMWYDGTTGSWNLGMGGGNITQQVGEELFVYGKASATVTDSPLQIIYKTGVVGASGVITFAPTIAGITNGELIIGIATESIALNAFGRITAFGVVRGITTDGSAYGETWADGDTIWYNPVTGNPTKIKPTAPNIKTEIGTIIKAGSGGSGSFQVEINHGSSLGGTDDNVNITSATNLDLLQYDSTAQYWKNVAQSTLSVGSATNLAGGAASQLPYQTGAGATSFVANGTAGQVLLSAGTSAPVWGNMDGGTF
tara:strand:+ start:784 stop:3210 length:2427 start_codon:yes stop_codon:yes gene_type:complete